MVTFWLPSFLNSAELPLGARQLLREGFVTDIAPQLANRNTKATLRALAGIHIVVKFQNGRAERRGHLLDTLCGNSGK